MAREDAKTEKTTVSSAAAISSFIATAFAQETMEAISVQRRADRIRPKVLVGALLLEQNDEWAVQRARYITLKTIAPLRDDLLISLPAVAR